MPWRKASYKFRSAEKKNCSRQFFFLFSTNMTVKIKHYENNKNNTQHSHARLHDLSDNCTDLPLFIKGKERHRPRVESQIW